MSTEPIEPPHPDDNLDQVAEEVATALEAGGIADRWIDNDTRSDESKAAADAYRAETMKAAAAMATDTRDIDPPPAEARTIESLATITNRVGPGRTRLAFDVDNDLLADIADQHLDAAAADQADMVTVIEVAVDHILHFLPQTIGPPSREIWRGRIEQLQAEDLGRIEQSKLDAWDRHNDDSDVRAQ